MEIWKPLKNFPGYEGSTEGRIRNIRTQHILSPVASPDGSMKLSLQKDGLQTSVKVKRVIAETFLEDICGRDIRHRDRDQTNTRPDNLYYSTRSETIKDAYARGSKLPYQQITVRVIETGDIYSSIKECSKELGCDPSYIREHLAGIRENVKGLHIIRE